MTCEHTITPTVVNIPVANLRKEPNDTPLSYNASDPLQETQLLYGEQVSVLKIQGDWAFVYATEQPKWHPQQGWIGYPGWIRTNFLTSTTRAKACATTLLVIQQWAALGSLHVTLGTRLNGLKQDQTHWQVRLVDGTIAKIANECVREELSCCFNAADMLAIGKLMVGDPYLWGGRSCHHPDLKDPLTGIDCSSLSQLLYRSQGVAIPRDAHDQFLLSRKIPISQLKPGDLIFLPDTKVVDRMGHVMLYIGNEILLEAVRLHNTVRMVTFLEKIGTPLSSLNTGAPSSIPISAGTYINRK